MKSCSQDGYNKENKLEDVWKWYSDRSSETIWYYATVVDGTHFLAEKFMVLATRSGVIIGNIGKLETTGMNAENKKWKLTQRNTWEGGWSNYWTSET